MKSIKNNLREYIETAGYTCSVGIGVPRRGDTAAPSPQVVIRTAGTRDTEAFDGTPDCGTETISIHCLSLSESLEASTVHDALWTALKDYTGTLVSGGRTVLAVHVMDQSDEQPERLTDDDEYWFTETLTLEIQHQA